MLLTDIKFPNSSTNLLAHILYLQIFYTVFQILINVLIPKEKVSEVDLLVLPGIFSIVVYSIIGKWINMAQSSDEEVQSNSIYKCNFEPFYNNIQHSFTIEVSLFRMESEFSSKMELTFSIGDKIVKLINMNYEGEVSEFVIEEYNENVKKEIEEDEMRTVVSEWVNMECETMFQLREKLGQASVPPVGSKLYKKFTKVAANDRFGYNYRKHMKSVSRKMDQILVEVRQQLIVEHIDKSDIKVVEKKWRKIKHFIMALMDWMLQYGMEEEFSSDKYICAEIWDKLIKFQTD